MSVTEVDLLNQKLDILIDDFQSHRKHSVKQEQITELKTTIKFIMLFGGFAITTAVTVLAVVVK